MDVVVEDGWHRADTVSRRHAWLPVLASGPRIEDLGSSNGTRVGATQLLARVVHLKLREPAEVALGKLVGHLAPWRGP